MAISIRSSERWGNTLGCDCGDPRHVERHGRVVVHNPDVAARTSTRVMCRLRNWGRSRALYAPPTQSALTLARGRQLRCAHAPGSAVRCGGTSPRWGPTRVGPNSEIRAYLTKLSHLARKITEPDASRYVPTQNSAI